MKLLKLSDAIRTAMEEKKLSAEDFAARAKIARSTAFKLLGGTQDVRTSTLRKLRKAGVKHPLVDAA